MPTGYTANVVDGKVTELAPFVLQCCRAFGACVELRDEPLSKPIPKKFEPSHYHLKALAEAEEEVERLEAMTDKARLAHGQKRKEQVLQSCQKAIQTRRKEGARVEAMLAKVKAWKSPTPEHDKLKKFMLEQLEMSREDSDFWETELERNEAVEPLDLWKESLTTARNSIQYHTVEMEKEKARAESNTQWVQAVRDSLK